MSSSLLKASNVVQYLTDTKNVASGTVTTLATADTSDRDAYYLLIGICTPSVTNSAKNIQARLSTCVTRVPLVNSTSACSVTVLKGNGGTRALDTHHDYGSAIDIAYKFVVIKLN